MVFHEGHSRRLPINFGRRSDEHRLLLSSGRIQYNLSTAHIRLDRVNRLINDKPHTDGCREMDGSIATIDEFGDKLRVQYGAELELKCRVPEKVLDVAHLAG